MTFTGRRVRNVVLLIIVSVLAVLVFQVIELSLLIQQYYSGWALVAVVVMLMMFYLKKKFSVLPIGSNASWAQWHYYGGLFLSVLFFIHIEFSIPDGLVEQALAATTFLVILVGCGGLVINRLFAKRLSLLREEVIYERIEPLRRQLKQTLEEQLLLSVKDSKSSTLSSYYLDELAEYFAKRHDFFAHIIGSTYQHQKRRTNLEQQLRYLNSSEASFVVSLLKFLDQKHTLDRHATLQGVMKYWGVLHAPMAVVMSSLVLFHIVLVYAFRGGM